MTANKTRWMVLASLTVVWLGAAADVLAAPGAAAAPISLVSAGSTGWTVYHGDAAGDGVAAGLSAVNTAAPVWTSPQLDGDLYGQPLVFDGRVYVATENNSVYALSGATGAVIWRSHLAAAVPSSELPCGDISPELGITGTPVIDPVRNEIFAVADELVAGAPAHTLVGLSTATGATELSEGIDPPSQNTGAVLQRTGMTIDDGRVIFAMGGNDGDCATYRGRVISVPEGGGTPSIFTVDAAGNDSQGAVWMGGAAPVVDASGQVLVAVGNGSVENAADGYDDSDSVLALSPTMGLEGYFAPSDWPANNSHDADMSAAPALLSDGQVVLAGKSRIGYLLASPAHLGGIGGQQAALADLCGEDIDGGVAVSGDTVYLPCLTGPVAVSAASVPASLHVLWRAEAGGGPPVLAAGRVWTISQNGVLYGLDPTDGVVRQLIRVGDPTNHFPTSAFGAGLMLIPAARDVVALTTTSTATPGTVATALPTPAGAVAGSATSPAASSSLSTAGDAGIRSAASAGNGHGWVGLVVLVVVLILAVLVVAAVTRWRRRGGPPRTQ